jgi:hypothetical protein
METDNSVVTPVSSLAQDLEWCSVHNKFKSDIDEPGRISYGQYLDICAGHTAKPRRPRDM